MLNNQNANKHFYAPLFTKDELHNQPITSFSTATFVNIDSDFFLVTPAHALYELNGLPAMLGLSSFHNLGDLAATTDKEFADLAAIKLSDEIVMKIADEVFFVTEDLVNRRSDKPAFYEISGLPANKNRQKTASQKMIRPHVLNITSTKNISDTFFPHKEYPEIIHFALEYDKKKLLDNSGNNTNEYGLSGVSGGIVVEYFDPLDFRTAGIFLARKNKKKH